MKFILILGAPAVGKRAVREALSQRTGIPLFHNHQSIELILPYFYYDSPAFSRLNRLIRFGIFEEVAQSDSPGLIFTLVWDYNDPKDEAYTDEILEIFQKAGASVHLIELQADLEERKRRNRDPERLQAKPSKQDVEASEQSMDYFEKACRMVSRPGEFPDKPILQINITH
ncbi:MAG: hypothetical protein AAFU60_04435 [Bacteroidota bacterium]